MVAMFRGLLILSHCHLVYSQCRYVTEDNVVHPIDICSWKWVLGISRHSKKFVCTEDGLIQLQSYSFSDDCNGLMGAGDAFEVTSFDNCEGSTSDCPLVNITYKSCDDDQSVSYIVVANQCGYPLGAKMTCDTSKDIDSRMEPCVSTYVPNLWNDWIMTDVCTSDMSACYGGNSETTSTKSATVSDGSVTIQTISSSINGTWIVVTVVAIVVICIACCIVCSVKTKQTKERVAATGQRIPVVPNAFQPIVQNPAQPAIVYIVQPANNVVPMGTHELPSYHEVGDPPAASAPFVQSASVQDQDIDGNPTIEGGDNEHPFKAGQEGGRGFTNQ